MLVSQGGSHPQMSLLYGDLDLREAGQMAEQLEKAHIAHELGPQDDRLLVLVGPCSIHDTKAAREYGALLKKAASGRYRGQAQLSALPATTAG